MPINTDIIVYIWLAPLVIYILFPFVTLSMYLVWRLVYVLFNPLGSRMKEDVPEIVAGNVEEIA